MHSRLKQILTSKTALPLLVFLLALSMRLYWIEQKKALYGDEFTSVSIAYDNPGWAEKTFPADKTYTGQELRALLYTDGGKGFKGMTDDLAVLHTDNGDRSHASLYYMALRCALTGNQTATMDSVMKRGCMLNLLFFTLSFTGMWLLLRKQFATNPSLTTGCLLVAFLNPASISNTLLLREYAMAEAAFSLWAYWCLCFLLRLKKTQPGSLTLLGTGIVLAALLLSCGYFNLLFFGITLCCLLWTSFRYQKRMEVGHILLLVACSILLCRLMYSGYFNFLTDVRTQEVSEKLQGTNWMTNMRASAKSGILMFVLHIASPIGLVAMIIPIVLSAFRCKRNAMSILRSQGMWLFGCACIWSLLALLFSPWKLTHYLYPALPLCMSLIAWLALTACHRPPKAVTRIFLALFAFSSCYPHAVEHTGQEYARTFWPRTSPVIALYGPDCWERNSLTQLSPFLGESQKCIIAADTSEIRRQICSTEPEDTLYVYADKDCPVLRTLEGYQYEQPFNNWMHAYLYTGKRDR